MRRLLVLPLSLAVLLAACRGEQVEAGRPDASEAIDTAVAVDGGTETNIEDTSTPDTQRDDTNVPADTTVAADTTPADTAGDSGGPITCPTARGPKMLYVAAPTPYCIDETEVTDMQFNAFIGATDKPTLATFCAGRMSTLRTAVGPSTRPAVNVEWCHAYAYCKWAGKRLCGKHGGGSVTSADVTTGVSQWSYACSGGSSPLVYPYGGGTAYEPYCVGDSTSITTVKPVDEPTYANCHGRAGFESLMHMAGNAREWEDSCDTTIVGSTTECQTRGGSWSSAYNRLTCVHSAPLPVTTADAETGFRCCYDGT